MRSLELLVKKVKRVCSLKCTGESYRYDCRNTRGLSVWIAASEYCTTLKLVCLGTLSGLGVRRCISTLNGPDYLEFSCPVFRWTWQIISNESNEWNAVLFKRPSLPKKAGDGRESHCITNYADTYIFCQLRMHTSHLRHFSYFFCYLKCI